MDAQRLLRDDWGVAADVWSVTSWNELRRDAVGLRGAQPHAPGLTSRDGPTSRTALEGAPVPFVAVSDWMRAVPDLLSRWVPGDYTSLGTDGFGRSDTRASLRRHFRVDPESIAVAVLTELARRGEVDDGLPRKALEQYALRSEQVPADKDTTEGGSE
jgi:pyruvate dehydrogenase E1 component